MKAHIHFTDQFSIEVDENSPEFQEVLKTLQERINYSLTVKNVIERLAQSTVYHGPEYSHLGIGTVNVGDVPGKVRCVTIDYPQNTKFTIRWE